MLAPMDVASACCVCPLARPAVQVQTWVGRELSFESVEFKKYFFIEAYVSSSEMRRWGLVLIG